MYEKRWEGIILAGIIIVFLLDVRSYAADNVALIQCLMRQDKDEIIGCLDKKFPIFTNYLFTDPICKALGKEEECKHKGLEELLNTWQVLYSQCSGDISAAECIAKIDIRRCEDLDGIKDDNEWNGADDQVIGAPGSKGACYALGAFLKKDMDICEKRFYIAVQVGCNSWLRGLSLDCLACGEELLSGEDKDYFYSEIAEAQRDISYCRKVVDQKIKDDCFSTCAGLLKDAGICEQVSDRMVRDGCYMERASVWGKEDLCDKMDDFERRNQCHRIAASNAEALKKQKH